MVHSKNVPMISLFFNNNLKTLQKIILSSLCFLFFISIHGQAFADSDKNEKIFPEWVKMAVSVWINGDISDEEFQALIENILSQNIIPNQIESEMQIKYSALNPTYQITEHYETELKKIPSWVKERATWWTQDKITDIQFLHTLHYLRDTGYIKYNPQENVFKNLDTLQPSLEQFLLSEEEILQITEKTKWRFISTEYQFEEKEGMIDSVRVMLKDITRVYEPMFYKYKVPSMIMQISEFSSENDLEKYWNTFEGRNQKIIFEESYLKGEPNSKSQCFFSYTSEGAVTSCTYEKKMIQIVIYDLYNEHYNYDTPNLQLSNKEPTTQFMSKILKKISSYKKDAINNELYKIFEKNIDNQSEQNFSNSTKEPEKSIVYGIKNLSCFKDDFGLVTISGQYFNDNSKKEQVNITISFLDKDGKSVADTHAILYNVNEFESKRFVGHTKWDGNFYSCKSFVN